MARLFEIMIALDKYIELFANERRSEREIISELFRKIVNFRYKTRNISEENEVKLNLLGEIPKLGELAEPVRCSQVARGVESIQANCGPALSPIRSPKLTEP